MLRSAAADQRRRLRPGLDVQPVNAAISSSEPHLGVGGVFESHHLKRIHTGGWRLPKKAWIERLEIMVPRQLHAIAGEQTQQGVYFRPERVSVDVGVKPLPRRQAKEKRIDVARL